MCANTLNLCTTDGTYLKIINRIYDVCNHFYSLYKFKIYFQKCYRETHHGIIIADRLAKFATQQHFSDCKIGPIARSTAKKLVTKYLYQTSKTNAFKNLKNDHVMSRNVYKWKSYLEINLDIEKEMALPNYQTAILLKLRSGHNELHASRHQLIHHSEYTFQMQQQPNKFVYLNCINECCKKINAGLCSCGEFEDVYHFILQCNQYDSLRFDLIQLILPSYHLYNVDLNLKTLLYPPCTMNWEHRKLILNSLCQYVLKSGRFNSNVS